MSSLERRWPLRARALALNYLSDGKGAERATQTILGRGGDAIALGARRDGYRAAGSLVVAT